MESLPAEARRDLILSLNTHQSRRPLSPVEVARLLDTLLNAGMTFKDLAESIKFESTSTLREVHRLLRLPEGLHGLVGWGRSTAPLSMTAASQLARLASSSEQEVVAEAILREGLSAEETRQVVETRLKSGKSIEDSIRTVLDLRPTIQRRDVLIGAITSKVLEDGLLRMSQAQRDQFLLKSLADCFDLPSEWTGVLVPTRFTLIGSNDFALSLRGLPAGFEAAVNRCLEQKLIAL